MKDSRFKYLFLAVFVIIAILSFLVIKPFIPAILTSIVLAYLFHPFYKKLNKKVNSSFSALIILIITLIIFILPTFFIAESLFRESLDLYEYFKTIQLDPKFSNALDKVFTYIAQESRSLITSIPKFFIDVFITLFLFYYFLKEGNHLVENVKNMLPLEKKHKDLVVNDFKKVTSAVVYGIVLIGLIVGVLGAIGFYIFNVSNPILLGVLLMIVSMLPGIGNLWVWVPVAVVKLFQGDYFNGVGLIVYSLIFISGLEMFYRPKLISYKSDIHPTIVLLGIFGGIAFLGFIGVFFGPLILVTFITFLKHLLDHE